MNKFSKLLTSILLPVLGALSVEGAVKVVSPESVLGTHGYFNPAHLIEYTIDGEELTESFMSGETDYHEFMATSPQSIGTGWFSELDPIIPYVIDFDLGQTYTLQYVTVWLRFVGGSGSYYSASLMDFSLSNDPNFDSSTYLGRLEIPDMGGDANEFVLDEAVSGRYLRMELLNNFDDSATDMFGFAEIVVGAAIPEPSTYALFIGLGALGLASIRRRIKNAQK